MGAAIPPPSRRLTPSRLLRTLFVASLTLAGAALVPRAVCGRRAEALWQGDLEAQRAFAVEVASEVRKEVGPSSFSTGSARFDGEWALVTHQMTALGLGQVILAHPEHPELRNAYLPVIRRCAERLLAPASRAFGTEAWGEDGLHQVDSAKGHAYLGYANLALSMLSQLDPEHPFAAINDLLTEAFARRIAAAPHALLDTYPGEAYPADMAAVMGSIGLHDRARGKGRHRAALREATHRLTTQFLDPSSGLFHQRVDARSGKPVGPPRASGTAIAAYFLSFADAAVGRQLFAGMAARQRASFLGFGGVREYAAGEVGLGDIDSGPVLFGVSVSATGFALAGARLAGEHAMFVEIYRTADLFGIELHGAAGGRRFLSGGPLGNAILFAMTTAGPPALLDPPEGRAP
ncbi:hypothetical protein [Chondromyces crocatus]|uniref:Linalool dehydratase/isomerase domain-containing protein n=1 Tax=Chondromyces crocatus TaxID=52 RepID=A0A0K1E666_CHOCO|nr:hypothetical protein [Chondromyces crocatus]AKT36376.1 uncharacterized protein CMC5_004890 [Chondromyces crocatus]